MRMSDFSPLQISHLKSVTLELIIILIIEHDGERFQINKGLQTPSVA